MKYSRQLLAGMVLILALLACNLPPSVDQVPPPSDVQTAAALTVEALLQPPVTSTTQQEPQSVLPNTATPTVGPTGTITPTYSVPMLKVLEQTNCRSGPGQDYEVVYTYLAWKELEIVGNYPEKNYWLVKSPESPNGVCWLWGEYVEVSGSYWVVSSVTPPPTATIPPPKAPSVEWDYFCSYATNKIDVTLKWSDVAISETGYRVIRNGQLVAELPADSTTFIESIDLVANEKTIYEIEVYNGSGSNRSSPVSFTC
jgi:hypothetical protein